MHEPHIDSKHGVAIVICMYVSVTAVNDKIQYKSHLFKFCMHSDKERRVILSGPYHIQLITCANKCS